MPRIKLTTGTDVFAVIEWLVENVGPSCSYDEQTGEGWLIGFTPLEDPHADLVIDGGWVVTIADERLATLFLLRWA